MGFALLSAICVSAAHLDVGEETSLLQHYSSEVNETAIAMSKQPTPHQEWGLCGGVRGGAQEEAWEIEAERKHVEQGGWSWKGRTAHGLGPGARPSPLCCRVPKSKGGGTKCLLLHCSCRVNNYMLLIFSIPNMAQEVLFSRDCLILFLGLSGLKINWYFWINKKFHEG